MEVLINGITYIPSLGRRDLSFSTAGDFLRSARKSMRLSMSRIATDAGLSKSYIFELENNTAEPSLRSAVKICKAYGISIDELARFYD